MLNAFDLRCLSLFTTQLRAVFLLKDDSSVLLQVVSTTNMSQAVVYLDVCCLMWKTGV